MSFFRQFPITTYDFLRNGVRTNIVDLFRNVTASSKIKLDRNIAYTYYRIQNGDRPDVVSQKLYDDPDYYWTFFIINDHLKTGMNAWPLASHNMEEFLTREYDPYSVISMVNLIGNTDSNSRSTNVTDIDFTAQQYVRLNDRDMGPIYQVMKYDAAMQQIWLYNDPDNPLDSNTAIEEFYISINATDFSSSKTYIPSQYPNTIDPFIAVGRNAPQRYVFAPEVGDQVNFHYVNRTLANIESATNLYNGFAGSIVASSKDRTSDVLPDSSVKGAYSFLVQTWRDIDNQFPVHFPVHYTDVRGIPVTVQNITSVLTNTDSSNPQIISPINRIVPVTYADYEFDLNEERSKIRVVNPQYIRAFVQQYREVLNA